jgi:lipid-A-disaccharide synthase-like uncharacterized protein
MKMDWIFLFGLIVQVLFSARMFAQWILSEKAKKVVSPVIYWQLSLIASFLFLFYGWFRADFAIILGQLCSYYIYIWNLNILNQWKKIHPVFRVALIVTPAIVIGLFAVTDGGDLSYLWKDIAFGLLLFGSFGQLVFAFRFIYQWWYSRQFSRSILPNGFWILSIIGSISILIYGIIRKDPILILSHCVNFITYSRNLYLNRKNSSSNT